MKNVDYTVSARRSFGRLPPEIRAQLADRLAWYAGTGAGDIRRVHGAWRLRSGDYRAISTETLAAILVHAAGHRRDIYRKRELPMAKVQFISTEGGEELVVLDRRDYDALRARAGDEAAEDALTAAIVAGSEAAIARGHDAALPEAVWKEIEGGASPIRVVRRHRGLTQGELAGKAGITATYLSEIERGRKVGTPETLKALCRALGVPLDLVVG